MTRHGVWLLSLGLSFGSNPVVAEENWQHSKNIQFDYVGYDGDIPGVGSANATRMLFQPSLVVKLPW